MQAVILAGGKGTRLLPNSASIPKPLVRLGGMPILEILLRQCRRAEIDEVFLAIGHLGHLIEEYFGDGSRWGIKVRYSREEVPLGTAGPIGALIDRLDDDFLVANGDLLTTLSFTSLIASHRARMVDATIGAIAVTVESPFGVVEFDAAGLLADYREKPRQTNLVSMGAYVLNREAVRGHLQPNTYLDLPSLMLLMRDRGQRIGRYSEECFWLDIGRPEDLTKAQGIFAAQRELFLGAAWEKVMPLAIVTGGDGFIGRSVRAALRDANCTTVRAGRGRHADIDLAALVSGTARGADCLRHCRPDLVFHLAGASDPAADAATMADDLRLARGLLESVRLSGLSPAVIFVGSAAEYGTVDAANQPASEDWVCAPQTAYGQAKLAQTRLAMEASERGMEVVVARLFNVIGQGMPARTPLAEIAGRLAASQPGDAVRTGRLDLIRDWANVADIGRVLVALATDRRARGKVINVCTGAPVEFRSLVERMVAALPWRVRLTEDPGIGGSAVPQMVGNPARLNKLGLVVPAPDFAALLPAVLGEHLAATRAPAAG